MTTKEKKERIANKVKEDRKIREAQEAERNKVSKEKEAKDMETKQAREKSKAVPAPKKKGKTQRLVRADRAKDMVKQGWATVSADADAHGRILGVRTNTSDLVLMEK